MSNLKVIGHRPARYPGEPLNRREILEYVGPSFRELQRLYGKERK